MKEYFGILEAVLEPNGETSWSIYTGDWTKNEWSYEFLIPIKPGDLLKILASNRDIDWQGNVKFSSTKNHKIKEYDRNIHPLKWEKYFNNRHFAILIKNED